MKKILLAAIAPVVLVTSLAMPGSAEAAVTSGTTSNCGTKVCVFKDNNFLGTSGKYTEAQPSIGISDQVSSIANGRAYRAYFHKDTNYGGNWVICLNREKKDNDLPNDRNDEISSVNFASQFQYC